MKLLYHIPQAGQNKISTGFGACVMPVNGHLKVEPFTVKKNEPHRFIL